MVCKHLHIWSWTIPQFLILVRMFAIFFSENKVIFTITLTCFALYSFFHNLKLFKNCIGVIQGVPINMGIQLEFDIVFVMN